MLNGNSHEYVFHEVNEGVFVRKCYGFEELVSNMTEYCDGFTHLTVTAAISLATPICRETLEERARAAWTSFRHLTPAIACKTFKLFDGDKRFSFRYTVPRSQEDIEAWLNETVFFSEGDDVNKTLYENHCELKNRHWWRSSDDHYVLELHVSPMEKDWAFSLVFSHNSTDGRNSYAMLDIFLAFLSRELDKTSTSSMQIEWGTEVARLPPSGAIVQLLAESATLNHIDSLRPKRTSDGAKEVEKLHWLYPTHRTNETDDVSHLVQFSQETTAELHRLSRRKGRTITQVITALCVLAHAETALKTAGKAGQQHFEEVVSAYNAATHYIIPWSFVNQRSKLPGGYDSYMSQTSAPLSTADCVPLSFPMDGIRSCIKVNERDRSAIRVVNEDAFWDVLVRDIADAWKDIDKSLDGYTAREGALHHAFDSFTPQIFDLPTLIVSSIGDLGRLGFLLSFVPPQVNEFRPTLMVNDVICGIRVRTPPVMNLFWEYRGRIACHFMSGGEYTASNEMKLVTSIFEELTETLVLAVITDG